MVNNMNKVYLKVTTRRRRLESVAKVAPKHRSRTTPFSFIGVQFHCQLHFHPPWRHFVFQRQKLCSHFSHHVRSGVSSQVWPFSCSTINTPLILISFKSKTQEEPKHKYCGCHNIPLLFQATALFVKVRSKQLNDAQRKINEELHKP